MELVLSGFGGKACDVDGVAGGRHYVRETGLGILELRYEWMELLDVKEEEQKRMNMSIRNDRLIRRWRRRFAARGEGKLRHIPTTSVISIHKNRRVAPQTLI